MTLIDVYSHFVVLENSELIFFVLKNHLNQIRNKRLLASCIDTKKDIHAGEK